MKSISDKIQEFYNDYSKLSEHYKNIYNESLNQTPLESLYSHSVYDVPCKVSIIIPSWNSEESIIHTLQSIEQSNICIYYNDLLEVIIVDDGSEVVLDEYLNTYLYAYEIKIIRQEHKGRAYSINNGVTHSNGDILIFMDSDVILYPYALDEIIKRQICFIHEAICFGFREDLKQENICFENLSNWMVERLPQYWLDNRFTFDTSESWGSNMMLETNLLQNRAGKMNIWISDGHKPAEYCWQLYRMVYGFLFGVSKENFYRVGGFDECMIGWGWEDSCFTAKCISLGIRIIPVPSACAIHIDHTDRSANKKKEAEKNYKRMLDILSQTILPSWNLKKYNYNKITIKQKRCFLNHNELNYKNIMNYINENSILYFYRLGLLEKTRLSYYSQKKMSSDELTALIDCSIRLFDKELYLHLYRNHKTIRDTFLSYVADYFFDTGHILNNIDFCNDIHMKYCLTFDPKEHLERATLNYQEEQYYLAMLDYFAAYLLTGDMSDQLLQCKATLLRNKRNEATV